MKKIIALLLIVFFCMALAACGGLNATPPTTPETPPPAESPMIESENQTQWPDLELSITVLHEDSALPAGILHRIP